MIELRDIHLAYKDKVLIQNANAKFEEGKLIALIGRNGAGKSSLLKAIIGLNNNFSGSILLDDIDVKELKGNELAKRISFVSTERLRVAKLKVRTLVSLARSPYSDWLARLSKEDEVIVDNAISLMNLNTYKDRYIDSLSDGEAQRMMIARALAQDTNNIILDEASSFLDLPSKYELGKILKTIAKEQNKAILLSTHDIEIAERYADAIALIDNKELKILENRGRETSDYIREVFNLSL